MILERIDGALKQVSSYAGDVTEWVIIKKELLKILPAGDRTLFSTRDPLTKSQSMNDFEKWIVKKWHDLTGNELIISNHEKSK